MAIVNEKQQIFLWRNGGRSGKHERIHHQGNQAPVGAGNARPADYYTAASAKHRKISAGTGNRSGALYNNLRSPIFQLHSEKQQTFGLAVI